MSNLYLVTVTGERHEDHNPIGFYDFETLKAKCPTREIEENISDGKWHEITVLDIGNWKFSPEEINNYLSDPDFDITYGVDDYCGVMNINVIKVSRNMEIPYT